MIAMIKRGDIVKVFADNKHVGEVTINTLKQLIDEQDNVESVESYREKATNTDKETYIKYQDKSLQELRDIAKEKGIKGYWNMKEDTLIENILEAK